MVCDLAIFEEKKFWSFFFGKGPPFGQKKSKIFFFPIKSNHAPIDRSRRAEKQYVVFEVHLINFWVILVRNSVFEALE